MPELPEIETIRTGIIPYTVGSTILELNIHRPNLRWPIPKELLKQETIGQMIRAVERRGKYLLLACGNGHFLIHLGMSGQLQWATAQTVPILHDHVTWILDNGYQLRLNDPRRFGALLWIAGDWHDHFLLSTLGPEPLESFFNPDYLYLHTRNRRVAIKNWLMNTKMVAGIGNIYATEALFLANLHPARPARELTWSQCVTLVQAIQSVLRAAIQQGGTTLQDFRQSDGQLGYFTNHLQVYGRTNKPCPVCGLSIKTIQLGQRSSFYCPKCQS